jgi:hypothetical protein
MKWVVDEEEKDAFHEPKTNGKTERTRRGTTSHKTEQLDELVALVVRRCQ